MVKSLINFRYCLLSLLLSSGMGEMVEHIKFCDSSHSKHTDFNRFKGLCKAGEKRTLKPNWSQREANAQHNIHTHTHTHTHTHIYTLVLCCYCSDHCSTHTYTHIYLSVHTNVYKSWIDLHIRLSTTWFSAAGSPYLLQFPNILHPA